MRPVITLTIIAMLSGLLLSITYSITAPEIEKQRQLNLENAIGQLIPVKVDKKIETGQSKMVNPVTKKEEVVKYFKVFEGKNLKGMAVQVKAKGYGGDISILLAEDTKNNVLGVIILEASETPGLGDKAQTEDKDNDGLADFLEQFYNKPSVSSFTVKTDVDAISGATITSKAIASGVRLACNYLKIIKENEKK